eukprot:jgi/Mesen1/2470/ME000158S01670
MGRHGHGGFDSSGGGLDPPDDEYGDSSQSYDVGSGSQAVSEVFDQIGGGGFGSGGGGGGGGFFGPGSAFGGGGGMPPPASPGGNFSDMGGLLPPGGGFSSDGGMPIPDADPYGPGGSSFDIPYNQGRHQEGSFGPGFQPGSNSPRGGDQEGTDRRYGWAGSLATTLAAGAAGALVGGAAYSALRSRWDTGADDRWPGGYAPGDSSPLPVHEYSSGHAPPVHGGTYLAGRRRPRVQPGWLCLLPLFNIAVVILAIYLVFGAYTPRRVDLGVQESRLLTANHLLYRSIKSWAFWLNRGSTVTVRFGIQRAGHSVCGGRGGVSCGSRKGSGCAQQPGGLHLAAHGYSLKAEARARSRYPSLVACAHQHRRSLQLSPPAVAMNLMFEVASTAYDVSASTAACTLWPGGRTCHVALSLFRGCAVLDTPAGLQSDEVWSVQVSHSPRWRFYLVLILLVWLSTFVLSACHYRAEQRRIGAVYDQERARAPHPPDARFPPFLHPHPQEGPPDSPPHLPSLGGWASPLRERLSRLHPRNLFGWGRSNDPHQGHQGGQGWSSPQVSNPPHPYAPTPAPNPYPYAPPGLDDQLPTSHAPYHPAGADAPPFAPPSFGPGMPPSGGQYASAYGDSYRDNKKGSSGNSGNGGNSFYADASNPKQAKNGEGGSASNEPSAPPLPLQGGPSGSFEKNIQEQRGRGEGEREREGGEGVTQKEKEEGELCAICMDNRKDSILLDCGHRATCAPCGQRLLERPSPVCPICRSSIRQVIKIYDV